MTTNHSRAAVRVCAIADAECSRNCGAGACKRESDRPVDQHEAAPADECTAQLEASVKRYQNMVDVLKQRLHDAVQPESPVADERAALLRDALFYLKGNLPDSPSDHKRKAQVIAGLEELVRASSPNAAGAEGDKS